VASCLDRRRVIGTRVEVVGPTYLDITVRATVQSVRNASKTNLRLKIIKALDEFLIPDGWSRTHRLALRPMFIGRKCCRSLMKLLEWTM
jgi:hypothetical protein